MNAEPLVSVIIPVRGRAQALRRALRSTLAQTLDDFEAIVVDDASDEPLAPVCAALGDDRIRVLRLDANRGPAGARNVGLEAARGRIVAFLDSDDEWDPHKLALQAAILNAPNGPDAHVCAVRQTGPDGTRIRPSRALREGERVATFLYVENEFAQASGMAMRAEAARRAGFDETLRQYEDHLFLIRAEALGARITICPTPLATQHVDPRPDRLGLRDDAARARAFLRAAEGLLTRRERLGFALRCLGGALAAEDPAGARRLALRALAGLEGEAPGGGPLGGAALKLLMRAGAGERAYAGLRAAARIMRRSPSPTGSPRVRSRSSGP
ncbi:glycosyltransferase family 2 protein [Oceanicella actignis]|uniref:glycosyltransferase family 2 protein n=1 Tax=Oceanicella actignis TaxID=1189325 RepID=UPI00125B61A7|nr:glycosyltransferase family 2 protein [Oceanicella actignis]TYO84814.1 glycosyl transferase family 2 [Oceanicella actignis]